MKSAYLAVPLLCVTPFLGSCSTVLTSLATYGVKSMFDVQHASESPEAYYQLGRYYQAQDRFDEAAKAYERAVALRKDYVEAANALATAYAMQGRYDVAITKLEAAIERSPEASYLHNNLGYIHYLQGRYPSAIASLENATRLDPENRRAWRNLALAYSKAGATDKSQEAFARASRPAPRAITERAARPLVAEEQAVRSEPAARAAPTQAMPPMTDSAPPARSVSNVIETTGSMDIVPVGSNVYELRPLDRPPAVVTRTEAVTQNTTAPALPTVAPALKAFRMEVSNGNGKTGLAYRVAVKLKRAGMKTVRLTNQRPWQPGSEIQYTEGYALEAAQLANLLGQEAMMVRNDRLRQDINVRLVLGKDVTDETTVVKSHEGSLPMTMASAK